MTRSNFDDVGDFHEKFNLDNVTHRGEGLREVDPSLLEFRVKFLHEELQEFEDALTEGDWAKAFDALLDLAYVTFGTAHLLGFPWQRGWDEVQRANMQKIRAAVDGSDSKRDSAWDVVKPLGWRPPDIEHILFHEIPNECGHCHRYLRHITLRETIIDRGGTQWVSISCPCGRELTVRPA